MKLGALMQNPHNQAKQQHKIEFLIEKYPE
jgi:hypothetical protein